MIIILLQNWVGIALFNKACLLLPFINPLIKEKGTFHFIYKQSILSVLMICCFCYIHIHELNDSVLYIILSWKKERKNIYRPYLLKFRIFEIV